ncbi:MAG: diaminopimelate decarboxylase [Longispora sp.]|nr:diaminopimelate decarboxylase [Longispora sp. (in: high G+C Gram-positive bacteria)]
MSSHEAGTLHAEAAGYHRPVWLREPDDVNALLAPLWPSTVHRTSDGVLKFGGVDIRVLAAEHGTPAYLFDEDDFRSRCRTFRDAFNGVDVYYAAKAFCAKAVVRVIAHEGLSLDVCSGGELAVALAAGMPPERIALHGNNKSVTELERALDAGIGRIVVDSFEEIDRLSALARDRGVRPRLMLRVTVGVEAHTHEYISTAHEDQKFGFSLVGGAAAEAVRRILAEDLLELRGLHSHIGSQIFDTSGFEVSTRRLLGFHVRIREDYGVELPELNLGGGYGIAYTSQDNPMSPEALAAELVQIVEHECAGYRIDVPRLSIEPGRALIGPAMCTVYEVGTVKPVILDGVGGRRVYVSVDGGMSDNIRPALYAAAYSATLASRRSTAPAVLARVVGKHCESGDVLVRDEFLPGDIAPGDLLAVPGTGAYCRSMSSNYNHIPRPPVIAVRDGYSRVMVRRETEEDLLLLDVG